MSAALILTASKWAEMSPNGGTEIAKRLLVMAWGPWSCAGHEGDPSPWSEGAAGLAWVCFCPGWDARAVPAVRSGAIPGVHLQGGAFGSCRGQILLCQTGIDNPP